MRGSVRGDARADSGAQRRPFHTHTRTGTHRQMRTLPQASRARRLSSVPLQLRPPSAVALSPLA